MVATVAHAATTDGWGRSYSGQDACVACHNGVSATDRTAHLGTPHGQGVVDVRAVPAALVPSAASMTWWPSPGVGLLGPRFDPGSLYLMQGVHEREYIAEPGTPLPPLSPIATVPPGLGGPPDDLTIFVNVSWDTASATWHTSGPATGLAYIQMCAGCHNLGVTRPSATTATLASGATISPTTSSDITGLSIQCENCHGTGDQTAKHEGITPSVLAWEASATAPGRLLSSEVCGQCHVHGEANELSYSGWGMHSSPNGYTPDETLTAYFTPESTVPTEGQFLADPGAYVFYPNGSNKGMQGAYYNEWLQNVAANGFGHVTPKNIRVTTNATCYRCHSGEGFLDRIGDPVVPGTYAAGASTVRWGISCQVCHDPHTLGMRVSPDPTVGEVDCGDCHNWQYEVQAATVPTSGGLAAGLALGRVSHPQREMNAGRGLIGVADMGPFMDGVECADCHMPETVEGAPSHRFHVMLPGDAEEWGVPEGGDSCTRCHDTLSRAALQAYIDGWQAEVATLVADATAATTAARARKGWTGTESSFVATTSTDPEVVAYKEAYFDRAYVEADGTGGAHNPPYARAGLEHAIDIARSIGGTISLSAPATAPAGAVTVLGVVAQGDGTFESAEMVELQASEAGGGGFVTFASVESNGLGAYVATYALSVDTEFRAVWHSTSGDKTSAVRMVRVGGAGAGAVAVGRIAGASRYETAVKASQSVFVADACPNVVLASGANYPDALAANGLAGAAASPLLLTAPDDVPSVVMAEIARISPAPGATTVWLVGGTAAIGPDVATELATAGYAVQRIGGATRYDTAAMVAEQMETILGGSFPTSAFVVSGRSFADALAAAPVAYANGWPILLTAPDALSPQTASAIADRGITYAAVVGGPGAVSDAVIAALPAGSERVAAGADRHQTAALFAAWAIDTAAIAGPGYVGIASGAGFADALCAGSTAGANGGVVLLSTPNALAPSADAFLAARRTDMDRAVLFGGNAALDNDVFVDAYQTLNP